MIFREGQRRASLYMAVALAEFAQTVHAEVTERTSTVRGKTLHYKVVLPNNFDATKVYPAVLALGGGAQTMSTFCSVLDRYFRAEAEKRGYIVFAPAAPDDQLVLWDGADVFPDFLKQILTEYKIENG